MDPGAIALRCLFSFVFLLVLLRIRGKTAIAEATAFDFVLALIIGDMMDDLMWAEVPATQFVVAVATLMVADTLVSFVASRSEGFDSLVSGRPRPLLVDGRPVREAMRRELVNDPELERFLRVHGVEPEKAAEAKNLILENDGHSSLIHQPLEEAVTREQLGRLKRRRR